jgi:SAM-dependent methyltransferase
MSQVQQGQSSPTAPLDQTCGLCGIAVRERYRRIVAEETGLGFAVDACPACGVGRTRPVPVDLSPYYNPGYYGKRHGATGRICNRRRVGMLRRRAGSVAGRSLLDYGSGDGGFLLAARAEGWDGQGLERDPPTRSPGAPPVAARLDELDGRSFDCVTFWHVLEHLDDPVKVLTAVRQRMTPGGLALAAVPNFDSWQSRATGGSWLHLDLPRHLHHFTPTSIARTFEASGFVVEEIAFGEFEYDVIGWSQSLLNRIFGGRNEFFKAMSGRPGAGTSLRRTFQVAAGLALSAIAIAPAWIERKLRRGGTLIVAARSV